MLQCTAHCKAINCLPDDKYIHGLLIYRGVFLFILFEIPQINLMEITLEFHCIFLYQGPYFTHHRPLYTNIYSQCSSLILLIKLQGSNLATTCIFGTKTYILFVWGIPRVHKVSLPETPFIEWVWVKACNLEPLIGWWMSHVIQQQPLMTYTRDTHPWQIVCGPAKAETLAPDFHSIFLIIKYRLGLSSSIVLILKVYWHRWVSTWLLYIAAGW